MFTAIKAKLAPYALAVKAALVLALVVGAASASWYVRGSIADTAIAKLKLEHAQAQTVAADLATKQLSAVVARSDTLQKTIEGVSRDQSSREAAHRRTVAALDDQLRRLRVAAGATERQGNGATAASEATPTGQQPPPGTAAGVVQTGDWRDQLLFEAADILRELAPALQVSHERHTALVEAYEAARRGVDD